LPDEDTLTQLAKEFMAALPGGQRAFEAAPGNPPATTPGLAAGEPAAASPPAGATLVPAAASWPSAPAPLADAPQPAAGGVQAPFGVPAAYAAALPQVGPIGQPSTDTLAKAPGTPYYFLAEGMALQSAGTAGAPGPFQANVPAVANLQVDPLSAGIPGAKELAELLKTLDPVARPQPAGAPAAGNYYFVDARRAELPGIAPAMHPPFDVNLVRRDFPLLRERVNGRPLAWFDNAATTQKPQSVIDRLAYFYAHENSNIHRAAHEMAARATDAYEAARNRVARFLGAASSDEIVFVRGATEAINLVAKTYGSRNVLPGDEIVVSHLEHHANIVPWQQLCSEKGARLRVIPVDDSGQVLLDEYGKLLNDRTRIVAITQVSNALGTVTPVREIVQLAHRAGACVLVDGAQAVSHMRVNVQALDADFYVFSGHKVFGPTGIGVVYGKAALLEQMPPWQGGGNMIADVTFEKTVYQKAPARFEAGTGNIADAVGLGAAIDYLERLGIENVARYEHELLVYATHHMRTVPGLRLIGTASDKASVLSFVLAGNTPGDVGKALNAEGIAVRAGHHCAQPILRRFGLEETVRPSLAFYNTCEEVDRMIAVLRGLAQK
jgi:cysteine desulfurase/selenocysteine lyase